MTGDSLFSRRLLIGWLVAAALILVVALFLAGNSGNSLATVGPSTFSRSAIGYAGIADVLERLGFGVVRSRYDSPGRLTRGGVLVLAEPAPGAETAAMMRTLLRADTIFLVLPKWTGPPAPGKPAWLGEATPYDLSAVASVLHLVAPHASVAEVTTPQWSRNPFNITPRIDAPIHVVHGGRFKPVIGDADHMLLGQLAAGRRTIWVLADPDVISNHGLAQPGNAALAVAMIARLRRGSGNVVFDETIHGFINAPASPLRLLFRFPFVMATIQALIAMALLLWATLGRFGTPQPAPSPIGAGRQALVENIAKLIEFTGHREEMIRRYVVETVRDVARQLHAPRGLQPAALVEWLQRVGAARGVDTDCGALVAEATTLAEGGRRNPAALVRLARETHRWREEVLNGRGSHPRDR